MEKNLTEAEKPNNPFKLSLEIEKLLEDIPGTVALKEIFETKLYLLKLRNPHLYYHSQKVGIVAYLLALMHGLPTRYADLLQYAGWVHDLSFIFVPVQMHHSFIKGIGLETSWEKIYRLHPIIGAKILSKIPGLNTHRENIASIVLYHHENWDGTGFPHGLKGKEIPLGARIIRISDALIRLIDEPPRGEGLTLKDALFEILKYSKKSFDPELVSQLIAIEDTIATWLAMLESEEEQYSPENLILN